MVGQEVAGGLGREFRHPTLAELAGASLAVRRVGGRYACVMLDRDAWLGRRDFQQELMGVFFGSWTERSSASVTQQGEAGLCLFVDNEFRPRAGWPGFCG